MKIYGIIINKIFTIATGNALKRTILAPFVGSVFAIITSLFVIIPIKIDNADKTPVVVIEPFNLIISLPLIIIGIFLMCWSSFYFFKMNRTPVPVNPPDRLIKSGPYAFARNPMHSGMFILMFGIGIYYGSLLSVLIFTPLYIFIDVLILKNIEEPELEKRLGEEYIKYKKRVPMFIPKIIS